MFNPISSRAICSALNTKESRKHAPNSKTLQVILDVMVEPYALSKKWPLVQPQPSPPKETGHRRIWRQLLPSFLQKIHQTTHVLWFRFFLPTLKENCKQDTEVWDVFGIRTVQRVVESGRAIGPKVFEKPRDSPQWSKSLVRPRTEDLALRNLRNSWS